MRSGSCVSWGAFFRALAVWLWIACVRVLTAPCSRLCGAPVASGGGSLCCAVVRICCRCSLYASVALCLRLCDVFRFTHHLHSGSLFSAPASILGAWRLSLRRCAYHLAQFLSRLASNRSLSGRQESLRGLVRLSEALSALSVIFGLSAPSSFL